MAVKAFIFDLDGTLLDTSVDLACGINKMRQFYGLSELPVETVISYLGDGALQLTERSLKDSDISPEKAVSVFLDYYEENICVATDFYPGMREFISELNKRGISAGILTNKPQHPTDKLIEALGIGHMFDFIYGPDLFGKKPDPNGLIQCLKEINVDASEAFMVGDHHTDLFAANDAGVENIFVHYGFGRIGDSRADNEITTADELFKFL